MVKKVLFSYHSYQGGLTIARPPASNHFFAAQQKCEEETRGAHTQTPKTHTPGVLNHLKSREHRLNGRHQHGGSAPARDAGRRKKMGRPQLLEGRAAVHVPAHAPGRMAPDAHIFAPRLCYMQNKINHNIFLCETLQS